jgi:hypothetical protein
MVDEGVEQCGQSELGRCEVTCTSSSFEVSLIDVSSSPSGKGKSGVVGMACHSCNLYLQEHSRQINVFQWLTKNQEEPKVRRR